MGKDLRIRIAPSLLAADFTRLADEVRRAEDAGADWLHLDVMDAHFVPNLTIGPPVVESLRNVTRLPLDCHLMILEPEKHAAAFADAGADLITFHAEAVAAAAARKRVERGWALPAGDGPLYEEARLEETIGRIREKGKKVGIAVNPDTPAEVLGFLDRVDLALAMTVWPGFGGQKFIESVVPKIERLRKMSPTVDIEVDGGLDPATVRRAAGAGANVIVAGTATFRSEDMAGVVRALRANARSAMEARTA